MSLLLLYRALPARPNPGATTTSVSQPVAVAVTGPRATASTVALVGIGATTGPYAEADERIPIGVSDE